MLAIRRSLCPWGAKSSHDPRSHVLGLVLANKIAQLGSSSAARSPARIQLRNSKSSKRSSSAAPRMQLRSSNSSSDPAPYLETSFRFAHPAEAYPEHPSSHHFRPSRPSANTRLGHLELNPLIGIDICEFREKLKKIAVSSKFKLLVVPGCYLDRFRSLSTESHSICSEIQLGSNSAIRTKAAIARTTEGRRTEVRGRAGRCTDRKLGGHGAEPGVRIRWHLPYAEG